jgi:flagellin-like protein
MKDIMRKLRRNAKALSPIFAVLILIAIAVIGGIVIYMFTSGYLGTMMGGGSAGQEKVAVEAVQAYAATGVVTIHAKSTGGGDAIVQDGILKDAAGQVIEVVTLTAEVTLPADGALTTVDFTGADAFALTSMDVGYTYTVTIVTQAGNQFVSPSFKGQ